MSRWLLLFSFAFGCLACLPLLEGCTTTPSAEGVQEKRLEPRTEVPAETSAETAESTQDLPAEIKAEPRTEPTPEAAREPQPEKAPEPVRERPNEAQGEGKKPDAGDERSDTDEGLREMTADDERLSEAVAETPESSPEPIKTLTFEGFVPYAFGAPDTPIPGVKICIHQRPSIPCTTTDARGYYTLPGVPVDTPIYLTFTNPAKDLMPMMEALYLPSSLGSTFYKRTEMVTMTEATQIPALFGVTIDLVNKAHIVADIHEQKAFSVPVAGATITAFSSTSLQGPFYLPDPGQPATATGSSGLALFLNATPGDYDFSYSHPSRTCYRHPTAIPGQNDRSKATVLAGWLTVTSGFCDPLPPTP